MKIILKHFNDKIIGLCDYNFACKLSNANERRLFASEFLCLDKYTTEVMFYTLPTLKHISISPIYVLNDKL